MILDDFSTDRSAQIVNDMIAGDKRFKLIQQTEKQYALSNIVQGINLLNPKDEDVIMTVDGDDWLAHPDVLSKLKSVYERELCRMTYGSFQFYPQKIVSWTWIFDLPDLIKICGLYRQYRWQTSHLRTFKYEVYKHINQDDLKDESGQYYDVTYDLALMFPMLEICAGNIVYIPDVLYIYNRATPLNDDKVRGEKQFKVEHIIRKKSIYTPFFECHHPKMTAIMTPSQLNYFVNRPRTVDQFKAYYQGFADMLEALGRTEDAQLYHRAILDINSSVDLSLMH